MTVAGKFSIIMWYVCLWTCTWLFPGCEEINDENCPPGTPPGSHPDCPCPSVSPHIAKYTDIYGCRCHGSSSNCCVPGRPGHVGCDAVLSGCIPGRPGCDTGNTTE